MEATITIALTPEENLELTPEIREQFSNGENYSWVGDGSTIGLKKLPNLDWDELRKRRGAIAILIMSEIVKEIVQAEL